MCITSYRPFDRTILLWITLRKLHLLAGRVKHLFQEGRLHGDYPKSSRLGLLGPGFYGFKVQRRLAAGSETAVDFLKNGSRIKLNFGPPPHLTQSQGGFMNWRSARPHFFYRGMGFFVKFAQFALCSTQGEGRANQKGGGHE